MNALRHVASFCGVTVFAWTLFSVLCGSSVLGVSTPIFAILCGVGALIARLVDAQAERAERAERESNVWHSRNCLTTVVTGTFDPSEGPQVLFRGGKRGPR